MLSLWAAEKGLPFSSSRQDGPPPSDQPTVSFAGSVVQDLNANGHKTVVTRRKDGTREVVLPLAERSDMAYDFLNKTCADHACTLGNGAVAMRVAKQELCQQNGSKLCGGMLCGAPSSLPMVSREDDSSGAGVAGERAMMELLLVDVGLEGNRPSAQARLAAQTPAAISTEADIAGGCRQRASSGLLSEVAGKGRASVSMVGAGADARAFAYVTTAGQVMEDFHRGQFFSPGKDLFKAAHDLRLSLEKAQREVSPLMHARVQGVLKDLAKIVRSMNGCTRRYTSRGLSSG